MSKRGENRIEYNQYMRELKRGTFIMQEDHAINTEDTKRKEFTVRVAALARALRFCSFQLSILFGVGAILSGHIVHEHFSFCSAVVRDGTALDAVTEPLLSGALPPLMCLLSMVLCVGFLVLAKRCKDLMNPVGDGT